MLVDTAQEAALRVSAVATVLWVGTRRRRLVRVQRRLTALHVTLVGMALAAARQASALATVLLVGTLPQQLQQDRLQLTVLRVTLDTTSAQTIVVVLRALWTTTTMMVLVTPNAYVALLAR